MSQLPWEQYKDIIIGMYARHTLDEVVTMMIDTYQFSANARTYQKKFDKWGIGKRVNSRNREFALTSDGQYVPTNSHNESNFDTTASVGVTASSSAYTEPGNFYPSMGATAYAPESVPYQSSQTQYGYGMPDAEQFDPSQLLSSPVPEEHYPSITNDQAGVTYALLPDTGSAVQSVSQGPTSTATYQQVGHLPDNQPLPPPPPESTLPSHRSSRRSHNRSSRPHRSRD